MAETTAIPRAVSAVDVAVNRRRGGDIRVVLGPKTCGATTGFMGTLTLKPGEYVSEHYHPYSEEYLYVIRGSLAVRLDGEHVVGVGVGQGLLIPKFIRHRVVNDSDTDAFVVFHLCPLARRPELGHVDTEPVARGGDAQPDVGGAGAGGPVAGGPVAGGMGNEVEGR